MVPATLLKQFNSQHERMLYPGFILKQNYLMLLFIREPITTRQKIHIPDIKYDTSSITVYTDSLECLDLFWIIKVFLNETLRSVTSAISLIGLHGVSVNGSVPSLSPAEAYIALIDFSGKKSVFH